MDEKKIVSHFLNRGILMSPDVLINKESFEKFMIENKLEETDFEALSLFFKNIFYKIDTKTEEKNNRFIMPFSEKETNKLENRAIKLNSGQTEKISPTPHLNNSLVKIVFSYEEESKKRTCEDFISYFKIRFKSIRNILQNRQELQNVISIQRLNMKKEKETVSIIGMVLEIQKTKKGNLMVILEDLTDKITCVVSKENTELFEQSKEIVLDEVIGLSGYFNGSIIYVNTFVWPDVPFSKELKKAPNEAYAVFISDTEFGNKFFQEASWNNFIKWIRGEIGTDEQKQIVHKIKYLFIAGDLVDGVGIYPGQEADLTISDIYKQYEVFAEYLKQIPKEITIITSPGNHDAMRIAEPQPPLYRDFAAKVWELPNVINVSNPAIINIHASESFPGFDVLIYHGYSFTYYGDNVESLRTAGGINRTDLILKFLMKKRHLAPTHQSSLYLPTSEKDFLFIETVPDFFVTGHVHQVAALNYRNVTLLNCSCWLSQTPYQEKMGVNPEISKAIIVNLQTREIKIMRF